DADSTSLTDILELLERRWPKGEWFTSKDVLDYIVSNTASPMAADAPSAIALKEFLLPDPKQAVSKVSFGKALGNHVNNPVRVTGDRQLTLKASTNKHTKVKSFRVVNITPHTNGKDRAAAPAQGNGAGNGAGGDMSTSAPASSASALGGLDEEIPF